MVSASWPTGQVFTCQPSLIWASTLSPSVTATSRMLSPKRITLRDLEKAAPTAARIHAPSRSWTAASRQ